MNKTNITINQTAKSLRKYPPEELEKTLNWAKEAYHTGLIESADLENFLVNFKFRDTTKRYWTIGVNTGKWYYRSLTGWIEAPRPTQTLESISDLKLIQPHTTKDLTGNKEIDLKNSAPKNTLSIFHPFICIKICCHATQRVLCVN